MGSWAQSKLPLLMLPGKWWRELCQWKPSSEVGRHSPSYAGSWAGSCSVKHFFSTTTAFYWRNIPSSQIWKHPLLTEVIILLLYPSMNCGSRRLVLLFVLFVHLLTYFKEKKRIYCSDKERTWIIFFTRDFPVDMNDEGISVDHTWEAYKHYYNAMISY